MRTFDKILKRTPIETRLRVFFQMEWLSMNVANGNYSTDEEFKKSFIWSAKTVRQVMKKFKQWEKDGRPKYKKTNPKQK